MKKGKTLADTVAMPVKDNRIAWIDFMKGLAMIAVVVDHCFRLLYWNPSIQAASFYSVGLFIIVAGITSYGSMNWHHVCNYDLKYIFNRLKRLLIPYILATVVSLCCIKGYLDAYQILTVLLSFNCWPPYYFLAFFLELVLISPFLFLIIRKISSKAKNSVLAFVIFIFVICLIACICTQYTKIGNLYGGGKVLFGGSFLIFYVFGMIWASYSIRLDQKRPCVIFSCVSILTWAFYTAQFLGNPSFMQILFQLAPIWTFNPPGIPCILYTILTFFAALSLFSICKVFFSQRLMAIFKPIEICGKYSMTIFLYHQLFLFWALPLVIRKYPSLQSNLFIYRIVALVLAIVFPVLGSVLYQKGKNCYKKTWKEITVGKDILS